MSEAEAASNIYNPSLEELSGYEEMAWGKALALARLVDTSSNGTTNIAARLEDSIERTGRLVLEFAQSGKRSKDIWQHIAYASHAVCEYLMDCLERNEPWSAQFLFPPDFSLKEQIVPTWNGEHSTTADKAFAQIHDIRNIQHVGDILGHILAGNGGIHRIKGPMFSSKSGAAKQIYHALKQHPGGELFRAVFIFEGMGESSLHARAVKGKDIKAKKTNIQKLLRKKDELIKNYGHVERKVIFIEELTFFTFDEGEANLLIDALIELREHGFTIITTGLDRNYRGEELLIERLMRERAECCEYHLNSIIMADTGNGKKVILERQVEEAETLHEQAEAKCAASATVRYDMLTGTYDWFLPIFFPREVAGDSLQYLPMAEEYHPMLVLKRRNPQLHALMLAKSQEELKQHYIEKLAAKTIQVPTSEA
jgi:thymidine kinase